MKSLSVPAPGSAAAAPRWSRRRWLGAAAAGLGLAGCGKFKLGGGASPRSQINILIWDGYLSTEIYSAFEKETGIRVIHHRFSSNDELRGRLAAKDGTYDLAMPTAFMAKYLLDRGLITGLAAKNLPNLELVDRQTYNPSWDPQNTFTVPYIWGSTGIGYNFLRIQGLPKSWGNLFEPKSQEVDGQIKTSVLDDAHFTIGSALLYLKHSPNTTNPAEIEAAGELLLKVRNRIDYFENDHVKDLLAGVPVDRPLTAKEMKAMSPEDLQIRQRDDEHVRKLLASTGGRPLDLAMAWSADVTKAMKVNKKVRLSLPREGAIIFKDGFVIPRGAQRQAEAETFVNYLLRPEVAGAVTNESFYATTVPTAKPYVNRFIVNGPSYFIHPGGNKPFLDDNDSEADQIFQRVWAQVKAGKA